MSTCRDVSVSRPARQCISVDLPEPDGPMMAVKRRGGERDGDAVEGPHRGLAAPVDLDGVDGTGRRRGGAVGRRGEVTLGGRAVACRPVCSP